MGTTEQQTPGDDTSDRLAPDRAASFPLAKREFAYETITFLSDLGTSSEQVGVVKATIREMVPSVMVIDLTHEIAPFDVRGASLALARAAVYLNNGVIIAAVDPGAGATRRLIGVEVAQGRGVFLGPDNGILAPAVAIIGGAERAVILDREDLCLLSPGDVFAARDILAPVAAALCNGADLYQVGSPVDPGILLPGVVPIAREEDGGLACEVLWVDRFGNCQLNVGVEDLEALWGTPVQRVRLSFSDVVRNVPVLRGFGDLGPGGVGLVVDSAGLLCVAVDRGSATRELSLGEGEQVILRTAENESEISTPVDAPRVRQ